MGDLCRFYALVGQEEEALQMIEKTEQFFEQIPDGTHSYVADCIKEARELLAIQS
jgi:hypothetical protein